MAIIKNANANAENGLPMYTGYVDETTHIHIVDGNSEMGKGIYITQLSQEIPHWSKQMEL